MTSGPVVYLVLVGEEVIDIVRKMVGATKAADAVPGTIRGDYALPGTENIIHASDSRDAATKRSPAFSRHSIQTNRLKKRRSDTNPKLLV